MSRRGGCVKGDYLLDVRVTVGVYRLMCSGGINNYLIAERRECLSSFFEASVR